VVVELEADKPPEMKKALATVRAITIVNARSTYVLIEEPCFPVSKLIAAQPILSCWHNPNVTNGPAGRAF